MNREYRVRLYNALKAFVFLILLILIIVFLEFYVVAKLFRLSPLIDVLVILVTISLPFLLIKKIKNRYTKEAFLEFTSLGFSITTHNIKDNKDKKTEVFKWEDLNSYKIRFTQSKMTYLDLYNRNGIHKKYGFMDNKSQTESLEGDSIFSIYFSFIKQYNLKATEEEKVILKPGFLTTAWGNVLLGFVSFLFVTCLFVCIFVNPKGFPFLIMGGMSILILFLQRKKDKDLYDFLTLKELE